MDTEEELGPLSINPPSDLETQPTADEPALAPEPAPAPEPQPEGGDDAPATTTPTVDATEEPGIGQP